MHKDYINLSQNLNREVFQSKQTYDYHGIDIRFCMIMMINNRKGMIFKGLCMQHRARDLVPRLWIKLII